MNKIKAREQRVWWLILDLGVEEGLCENVTFGQEFKNSDRVSHKIIWEKSILDTDDNKCV